MSKGPKTIALPPLELNFTTTDDIKEEKLKVYETINAGFESLHRKHRGYRIVNPAFLRVHPWKVHVRENAGVDQIVIYSNVPTDGFRFSVDDDTHFSREHQANVLLLERDDQDRR